MYSNPPCNGQCSCLDQNRYERKNRYATKEVNITMAPISFEANTTYTCRHYTILSLISTGEELRHTYFDYRSIWMDPVVNVTLLC